MTLHMVHSGEFLGFPPTGRQVTIEELAVLRIADGKIAEEWVAFDFASLQQQIQPASPQQ